MPLASEFKVASVIDRCETYLLQTYFSKQATAEADLDQLMKFINYGVLYGTRSLEDSSVAALAKWLSSSVENHPLYSTFPARDKVKLLTARVKFVEQCCVAAHAHCKSSSESSDTWMKREIDRSWIVRDVVSLSTPRIELKRMHDSKGYLEKASAILQNCGRGIPLRRDACHFLEWHNTKPL